MSPAVHGGGPRWKSFEYNTLLSVRPFREERIMDANRYFTAMHNAMSSRLPGAQLLAAVRLQDLCGNDAYLEVRRMPGEHCATVCYSTMGRRGLNFQLFRKGWMLCHNESGQLTGQFPAKAESLLEDTDFHACCREDRLDAARTDRMVQELEGNEGQKHLEEYADSRDARCLATRDIRLARRLVRDCLFRGHGAAFTLGLWGHVCAGEDRYIKPYKPRANLLLDTTHTYEVCLWRTVLDAMPADPALTATQARQLAALREKFAAFPALGTELVPQNSMLREFIGK